MCLQTPKHIVRKSSHRRDISSSASARLSLIFSYSIFSLSLSLLFRFHGTLGWGSRDFSCIYARRRRRRPCALSSGWNFLPQLKFHVMAVGNVSSPRERKERLCAMHQKKKSLKKMYNSRAMWQMVRMEHWRSSRALIAQRGETQTKDKIKNSIDLSFFLPFFLFSDSFFYPSFAQQHQRTNDRMSLDY